MSTWAMAGARAGTVTVFFLFAVLSLAWAQQELFCVRCNATYIILEIARSPTDPNEVNLTSTLRFVEIPVGRDPMQLIQYAREGKIDPETLRKITTAGPVQGENVTFVFVINFSKVVDTTVQTFAEEKVLGVVATDSDGIAKLSTRIEGVQGCGSIIAKFNGTKRLLPTETSTLYCAGGVVPFVQLLAVEPWKCLTIFVLLGLLVAAVYATGRKPLAALDITTPKPPKPYEYPGYKYKKIAIDLTKRAATMAKIKAIGKGFRNGIRRTFVYPRFVFDLARVAASEKEKERIAEAIKKTRWWYRADLARVMLVKYVLERPAVHRKILKERAERAAKIKEELAHLKEIARKFPTKELKERIKRVEQEIVEYERYRKKFKFVRDLYLRRPELAGISAKSRTKEKVIAQRKEVLARIDAIPDKSYFKKVANEKILLDPAQLARMTADTICARALAIIKRKGAPKEVEESKKFETPPYYDAAAKEKEQEGWEARFAQLRELVEKVDKKFAENFDEGEEMIKVLKEIEYIDGRLVRLLERRDVCAEEIANLSQQRAKASEAQWAEIDARLEELTKLKDALDTKIATEWTRIEYREKVIRESASKMLAKFAEEVDEDIEGKKALAEWAFERAIDFLSDEERAGLADELGVAPAKATLVEAFQQISTEEKEKLGKIAEMFEKFAKEKEEKEEKEGEEK